MPNNLEFKLNIELQNDAFADGDVFEVTRILQRVAERLELEGYLPDKYQNIKDINGNIVGRFAVKPTE